jgi:type VI secretion system protein ImpJ
MPPLSPAYIHNAQTAVFDMLLDNVAEMLSHVSQEHRLHPFELRDGIFSIPMQAEWRGSRLVVGLRGQPERDLLAWMAGAVIGSASAWASLRDRRVLGAGRAPIEAAPELGLRGGAGYTLFEIDPQDAKVSAGDPLQIFNANETHEAQRPHEVVLFVKG